MLYEPLMDGRNNVRVYAKHWIRFNLQPISIKVCGGTRIVPTYTHHRMKYFEPINVMGGLDFLGLILFFEEKGLGGVLEFDS